MRKTAYTDEIYKFFSLSHHVFMCGSLKASQINEKFMCG